MRQVTTPPAFRRSEPDARRLSLIEACARVLAREGIAGASVRTIALEAALTAAMQAAGPAPRAHLQAFVTASLAPPIADPELLATWIAFWSLVRARPEIAALHDEQYGGFRTQLEHLLADCGLPTGRLRATAIAITALVDGLWLELCLSPHELAAEEAAAIARDALVQLTAEFTSTGPAAG
jgi:TetR/AcrR family transcriptional regulator, transcriptional repressor of bet genes